MSKEEENFNLIMQLFLNVATPILALFLDNCLTSRNLNLESFLNTNQHSLYHMCFTNKICCKCSTDRINVSRRFLAVEQLKLIFDCSTPTPSGHDGLCCASAKPEISTNDLDASFINSLLLTFFKKDFWDFLPNQDFGDFLNSNRHMIFHMNVETQCCMCTNGNTLSPTTSKLKLRCLQNIYEFNGLQCQTCSSTANGPSILPCTMTAKQNVSTEWLQEYEVNIIQLFFSPVRIAIATIIDIRNTNICHATSYFMSNCDFLNVKENLERAILVMADTCGTRRITEDRICKTLSNTYHREEVERSLNKIQEQLARESNLQRIVLDLTDTVNNRLDDQGSTTRNMEEKILIAEQKMVFFKMYMDKPPSPFIHDKVLTLNTNDVKHLCEDEHTFNIIPVSHQTKQVFMSTLDYGWIRFGLTGGKYTQFRVKKENNFNKDNQLFHIESVDRPNHYLTMGKLRWWVRAEVYNGPITDDDAFWDIRCLKTEDARGNILSKYMLVPKNSEHFLCVDITERLKGKSDILGRSKMFIFKRVK